MSRPNLRRAIAAEAALARRVEYERTTRGMSYEGLAARMSRVGCPIQASAIYKIEKGDPPRRITVDEVVALSSVFEMSIDDLLVMPDDSKRAAKAMDYAQVLQSSIDADRALADLGSAWVKLDSHCMDAATQGETAWLFDALRGVERFKSTLRDAESEDLRPLVSGTLKSTSRAFNTWLDARQADGDG